ncbi:aryl-alcohol dehydrogenase-like predicted oxidoreductase [Friedmanniella endophytica]|uniref:Aryl-alcohol dehydrogenase-like predicted oxidoreductase n=1 Tax=Microlunatus kandeliicorticis TaxID=1759536 RepID=A0A7W3P583_9ACTN|nr:aldo/keto reductase [Microlunatus kandeliicorticis]MBA8793696.1 aryl-alcohol dehydrogenase-like predicted oxidoreductase [Microlunatus kandeliicorticis]
MEYTHLGRTGLSVSRLCLGTMNFGPHTDEPTSHGIMDTAHDQGINFFDTANVYGRQVSTGRTEEIIGNWFATGGGRREKTVIATKVYGDLPGEGHDEKWPNSGKLSALNIRRALDKSLQRLQTDYIDLYQFHHVDRATPWDEIWQAMETAVAQGKVLYVGSSNFAGWHIAQAQAAAEKRNFLGLVSEQSIYNLLKREVESDLIPAAEFYGLGIIPWSPLQGGLLGGVLKKEAEGLRRNDRSEELERNRAAIEGYEQLADDLGVGAGTLGLAWLLHQRSVTAPIIGPRTPDQLDTALAAVDLKLEQSTLDKLDELFPGRKPSPEDYAW